MVQGTARSCWLLLMAKVSISCVQAKTGEEETYKPLVSGPARHLDGVDAPTLRWMNSLRKAGAA